MICSASLALIYASVISPLAWPARACAYIMKMAVIHLRLGQQPAPCAVPSADGIRCPILGGKQREGSYPAPRPSRLWNHCPQGRCPGIKDASARFSPAAQRHGVPGRWSVDSSRANEVWIQGSGGQTHVVEAGSWAARGAYGSGGYTNPPLSERIQSWHSPVQAAHFISWKVRNSEQNSASGL